MTEVATGIHRLKMPPIKNSSLEFTNAYLIQGTNGFLLVDPGWNTDETLDTLQRYLAKIGADITNISQILATHVHPDHFGVAGRLRQLSGANITFHEIERRFIESRYLNMDKLLEQISRWLINNGMPPDEAIDNEGAALEMQKYVVPASPDVTLHGGETIDTGMFTFQVLWTPGHSSGHVCLYEAEKKILIAGDHILPVITPNVGLHPQSTANPLGNYLNSLNDMKRLDAELVLPGHEEPFNQLRPRIDEIIQHHDDRNGEILEEIKGEPKTAYRIAEGITWDISGGWQALPLFHKRIATFETMAHLELMAINGIIDKVYKDGIIYYQKN